MRNNLKKYLNWLTPLVCAGVLVACGGNGTVSGSSSVANTGSLDNLTMVAPSSYPAGAAATVPIVVTNNGTETINNLNYAIDAASNTTGGDITIQAASAASCRIITANSSCTLSADIAATPASHPGSFSVATSQGAAKSGISAFMASSVLAVNVNVGLVQMPTNSSNGADGLTLYYPSATVGNEKGITQMIVTAVVTSANAGSFNTIQLVDGNGNPLNYTILSGNSGTGMTDLPLGSIVTFLISVPSGGSQVQFKAQTVANGTVVSTSTNSNTVVVTNPAIPTGIMNVSPNYFDLTPNSESQVITLSNSGNGAISSLSFTATSPLTELNNTCGATLAAGATCQYVVKFNKDIPQAGTSSVTVNYNDGSTSQSATATVNYTGVDPIAGLTITSNNPNFDFISRTNTPSQTALVTLTNSGNTNESGFSFSPVNHFTTNITGVVNPCSLSTTLTPGASCSVNLVYNNSVITGITSETIPVNYKFGQNALPASSNVAVTYQTVQSTAILAITPNPTSFIGIVNNNVDNNTQTLSVTNSGDETATLSGNLISGSNAALFSFPANMGPNPCVATLAASSLCNLMVTFGPTSAAAGAKTASLDVGYTPYTGASAITSSAVLSGQVSGAQSAVISQGSATANGFAGGTGVDQANQYQVQQSATAPTLTYTITNNGTVPATSFYIDSSVGLNGWSYSGCGVSLVSSITLNANGGTCSLTFTLNTSGVGSRNLDLSRLTMHWVDQDTPAGQPQAMSGTVYANVYAAPSIVVVTNPSSSIIIEPGDSFSMTATLSGGYNVPTQTIHASTATAGMSFTNNDCALNSQNSYSCSISADAANNAESAINQRVTLSNSTTPAMAPSPSTVTFAIAPAIVATIALPQTGQGMNVPTGCTTGQPSCYTSVAGTDGYGYLSSGLNIPYGVAWAYNGSGSLNPPTRFTVGTGAESDCITDNLTGLMWVKSPSSTYNKWRDGTNPSYTYPAQVAIDAYNTSNTCGHQDWYLPTVNDLSSLMNDGVANSATWLNTQGFSNVQAAYWSSSTYAFNTSFVWVVNTNSGGMGAVGKTSNLSVWPVRLAP